jgi:hypothetical protein
MIPYLCAFFLSFGLLFLIGLGPALALEPGIDRRAGAPVFGMAPALGLALVTAFAGIVAVFGPLRPWVWPGTGLLLALSAGLLAWRLRGRPLSQPRGADAWFWCGWAALGLALLVPAAWGGLSWLLGNQFSGDAYNYASMGMAYEQVGYKAIWAHSVEWVANNHLVMLRAHNFPDRLGTPFLIGWMAHWAGVGTLLWGWHQAVLAPFMAWPLLYSWLRRLRLRPWAAALASFVALAGFWVSLAQTLSAFSYLTALPLMAAFATLVASIEQSKSQRWTRWLLGGLLLHALLLIYSEMVVVLGLMLLAGAFISCRPRSWLMSCLAMALVALLIDPSIALYHLGFIWKQVVTHTGAQNSEVERVAVGFGQAFVWLGQASDWSRPFRALWGYWPAPVSWQGFGSAWELAGDLAGVLAVAGLLGGLARLRGWRRPLVWLLALLALLPLAMGLAALPLTSAGVYGKILTYGGPFLLLLLGLAALGPSKPRSRGIPWTALAALPLMLGMALSLAAWAPQLARRDILRPPYPYAGQEDIDNGAWQDEMGPVCSLMRQHKGELMLVGTTNMVVDEWLLFCMPEQAIDFLGPLSLDARTVDKASQTRVPRWLLMAREDLAGGDLHQLPAPAVYTHYYALFHLGPGDLGRFQRYMAALKGSWSTSANIVPSIKEYRFLSDGQQRFRATLKPLAAAKPGLRVCLHLNRNQVLMPWSVLGKGKSLIFLPGPGVQRIDLAAPKGTPVGDKVDLAIEAYPPLGPGR